MTTTLDTAQAQGVYDFQDGIPCRVLAYSDDDERISYVIGYFSARWGMNDNGLLTPPRLFEWEYLEQTMEYESYMEDVEFWRRGS